jgi:DUF4097 and DUF4098 domain-containing protein YvlB
VEARLHGGCSSPTTGSDQRCAGRSARRAGQHHLGPGELSVNAQQSGESIFLQVKAPERYIRFNLSSRSVRIEVSVPQATGLDISSADGALHVTDIKGDARLGTTDGSIRVDRFDGNLHARSSDGSVEVGGRFDLLDLNSRDGRIAAEVWKGSHMNGNWNLRSSDGSITLKLPEDISAFLDASTSDGHIDLQLPVEVSGKVEKKRVRGKLHGGGPTLQIHTSDGSITLRPL